MGSSIPGNNFLIMQAEEWSESLIMTLCWGYQSVSSPSQNACQHFGAVAVTLYQPSQGHQKSNKALSRKKGTEFSATRDIHILSNPSTGSTRLLEPEARCFDRRGRSSVCACTCSITSISLSMLILWRRTGAASFYLPSLSLHPYFLRFSCPGISFNQSVIYNAIIETHSMILS